MTTETKAPKERNTPYIFRRHGVFYQADCADDADAIACVPLNPGTIEIINCATLQTIWKEEKKP